MYLQKASGLVADPMRKGGIHPGWLLWIPYPLISRIDRTGSSNGETWILTQTHYFMGLRPSVPVTRPAHLFNLVISWGVCSTPSQMNPVSASTQEALIHPTHSVQYYCVTSYLVHTLGPDSLQSPMGKKVIHHIQDDGLMYSFVTL